MVEVLVEYDYTAKEPDELTIKKGDVIRDVNIKPGGWWEGCLHDKKGMFPDNFVRVINKDSQIPYRNKKDVARIRQCRVVFSYKQENQDELNLNVGDIITILGEEEAGWWRGLLNGKEGVFPSNFVEELELKLGSREDLRNINENDVKSPLLPPKPAKALCQVKYSYKAQNEDELSLKEGDIITVLNSDGQDPGWWKGELNGRVGVFPDNFVVLVYEDDKKIKIPEIPKVPITSPQRKSLEDKEKLDKSDTEMKTTPPIPSKKPIIPVKKSPSSIGSQGGLLAGLKKKIVDAVDGATGSKSQSHLIKHNDHAEEVKSDLQENAFDQVERTPMLLDVRATRVKAPGRRPPSIIFKDGELGVVNGNAEHISLDGVSEEIANAQIMDGTEIELAVKPKVREWEKHKAPWLEEMKLNQAKRTSTSPEQSRLKLTPTDKSISPEIEDPKSNKLSPFDKTSVSPIDMSKSMSAITTKPKISPNELDKNVVSRSRPSHLIPQSPQKRQSLTNLSENQIQKSKPAIASHGKVMDEKVTDIEVAEISSKQYLELLQRIEKLETFVYQQNQLHQNAIEELKGKLQLETDMRRLLQAELDKISQCVMQV